MDMRLPADAVPARRSLELARRMTDHSLTEARRAVMDLRTSALDEHDIATALRTWAKVWAEDENADIVIDVEGKQDVPQEVGHQVLRIAQEGIANALKHSGASCVSLWFRIEGHTLHLRVSDDGCGFEPCEAFASANGHFGLIGMRERADKVGGELKVDSRAGEGTRLDLTVPLG
jgi:signal transduction histidine kinase